MCSLGVGSQKTDGQLDHSPARPGPPPLPRVFPSRLLCLSPLAAHLLTATGPATCTRAPLPHGAAHCLEAAGLTAVGQRGRLKTGRALLEAGDALLVAALFSWTPAPGALTTLCDLLGDPFSLRLGLVRALAPGQEGQCASGHPGLLRLQGRPTKNPGDEGVGWSPLYCPYQPRQTLEPLPCLCQEPRKDPLSRPVPSVDCPLP